MDETWLRKCPENAKKILRSVLIEFGARVLVLNIFSFFQLAKKRKKKYGKVAKMIRNVIGAQAHRVIRVRRRASSDTKNDPQSFACKYKSKTDAARD